MSSGIHIGLLGPLEVRGQHDELLPLPGARIRALFIVLVMARGRLVPRGELIDVLWEDDLPADPVNALQALVSRLRRALPGVVVESTQHGYRLPLRREQVDVFRFTDLVGAGTAEVSEYPQRAARVLRDALGLWRGDPLLDAGDARFARADVESLRALRADALNARIDADLRCGRGADVVGELEHLVAASPTDERWHAGLMRALYAAGRHADAVAAYQRARDTFAELLGMDPAPELQRLHLAVLRGDTASLRLVASTRKWRRPMALPVPPTPLFGRTAELNQATALLAKSRLVTLFGTGGVGKTRLALDVAARFEPNLTDGVQLVELGALAAQARVADALLAVIGRDMVVQQQTIAVSPIERLVNMIGDKHLLLLLDSCEHLLDSLHEVVRRLLASCANVRILATSREPIGVLGEQVIGVDPLPLPDGRAEPQRLRGNPAIQLFVERAVAFNPSFELADAELPDAARICVALDGLPLAIELAAARLRVLSVPQIAQRLTERFRLLTGDRRARTPRHQTLRATVDWTWDLLTDAEQVLARRLAVFPAGAELSMVERVCADRVLPADAVLDVVTALVDKSMVVVDSSAGQGRYGMLNTIREYLLARLAQAGESDRLSEAHARQLLELAELARPELTGREQMVWLARLATEHDNFDAALRWAVDKGRADVAVRMVAALGWYWYLRGYRAYAADWAQRALAIDGDSPPGARALAMMISLPALLTDRGGRVSGDEHPQDEFGRRMAEALALADEASASGDAERNEFAVFRASVSVTPADRAASHAALRALTGNRSAWIRGFGELACGHFSAEDGDEPRAVEHYQAALAEFRATGERWGIIQALSAVAGAPDAKAEELLTEALRAAVELGASEEQVTLLVRLAADRAERGDLVAAHEDLDGAVALAGRLGITQLIVQARASLADVNRWQGNHEQASTICAQLLAELERSATEDIEVLAVALRACGHVDVDARALAMARRRYHRSLRLALRLGDPRTIGQGLLLGADLALAEHRATRAAKLIGNVDALLGTSRRQGYESLRLAVQCRSLLGNDRFTRARRAGARLPRAHLLAALAEEMRDASDDAYEDACEDASRGS